MVAVHNSSDWSSATGAEPRESARITAALDAACDAFVECTIYAPNHPDVDVEAVVHAWWSSRMMTVVGLTLSENERAHGNRTISVSRAASPNVSCRIVALIGLPSREADRRVKSALVGGGGVMPGYTDADNVRAFDLSEQRGALTEVITCGCCNGVIILDQPEEDPEPRNCENCIAWLDGQSAKAKYAKSLERKPSRKWEGRE